MDDHKKYIKSKLMDNIIARKDICYLPRFTLCFKIGEARMRKSRIALGRCPQKKWLPKRRELT